MACLVFNGVRLVIPKITSLEILPSLIGKKYHISIATEEKTGYGSSLYRTVGPFDTREIACQELKNLEEQIDKFYKK